MGSRALGEDPSRGSEQVCVPGLNSPPYDLLHLPQSGEVAAYHSVCFAGDVRMGVRFAQVLDALQPRALGGSCGFTFPGVTGRARLWGLEVGGSGPCTSPRSSASKLCDSRCIRLVAPGEIAVSQLNFGCSLPCRAHSCYCCVLQVIPKKDPEQPEELPAELPAPAWQGQGGEADRGVGTAGLPCAAEGDPCCSRRCRHNLQNISSSFACPGVPHRLQQEAGGRD